MIWPWPTLRRKAQAVMAPTLLGRSGWGTLTLPQHLTGATCCLLAFGVPTYSLDPNGSYLVPQEYCPASSEEFSKGWVWGVTWGLHLYKAVAQGS